ncbi:tetratricopeptide repeat protein [Polyangium aurulentum]|uniref:tetratricopeptide repeat protein n=1 Tax=Polyangium aurulentum TaxID=2567896 RepID=UPI0010ADBF63|nr:tetratricopeptide repeat protein [Polyangium aurulentum]UQA62790.1 sel1 repeat family protein [Polyangium aurulentum]
MKHTYVVGLGSIALLAACSSTPPPESPPLDQEPPNGAVTVTPESTSEPPKSSLPPELAKLEKSCNERNGDACFALGVAYYKGEGVEKDMPACVALMRKACDAGHAEGCFNVGTALFHGEGVAANKPASIPLFEAACKGGSDGACFNLGVMYAKGDGVEKDMAKARANFEQGCRLGDSESCDVVKEIDGAAAKASGSASTGVANANISVGSMTVDGLLAKDISCRLDSGGGGGLLGAFMGPGVAIGSLAKKKAQLDACAPGGAEPRVTWSFAGGRTTKVSVDGVPDKVKGCVEKVVKSAVATADGECAATLVAGKKK